MKPFVDIGVPFIDFQEQYSKIKGEVQTAISSVMESQQFILNKQVAALEEEFARKTGAAHAIGVASGSDALYLALRALGIGEGDEVVTTPFTFFATVGSIVRAGARPVFADIDPDTFNLDPAKVEKVITARTKAIMPVHIFGLSCDMRALMALATKRSLKVIEDAAQSFGSLYDGKYTGVIGDIGCYSFFPTKNLGGAGDGGMMTTNSKEIADQIKLLRVHGSRKKYFHEVVGVNSRLDEIQAAVVRVKLRYIDEWNEKRRELAKRYSAAFDAIGLPYQKKPSECTHNFHLYSVTTPHRDTLAAYLTERKIGAGVYYPLPLHLQACFRDLGYKRGDLPVTEKICDQVLSLPMYPELKAEAVDAVIDAVRSFLSSK